MPLEFVLKLEEEAGDPAVQLWRLVRFDVGALCAFPFDINEVHRLSRRAPDASRCTGRSARRSTTRSSG